MDTNNKTHRRSSSLII